MGANVKKGMQIKFITWELAQPITNFIQTVIYQEDLL